MIKIIVTSLSDATSKKSAIHYTFLDTVELETGRVKSNVFDDEAFKRLGFEGSMVTNLADEEQGLIVLNADYDSRGNLAKVEREE